MQLTDLCNGQDVVVLRSTQKVLTPSVRDDVHRGGQKSLNRHDILRQKDLLHCVPTAGNAATAT